MHGLAGLALRDERFLSRVATLLEDLTGRGSPVMRSRGRKLLARLKS